LKFIKDKIKVWNKEIFGNIFKDKQELEEKMEQIQQQMIENGLLEILIFEEIKIQTQLNIKDKQKETLWKHKSIIHYIKEGEINKKFFHRSTINRRQENCITSLKSTQGNKLQQH
jgi:hypothetical protein